MGNSPLKEYAKKAEKKAPKLIGQQAYEDLKADWCSVNNIKFQKKEDGSVIPQTKDFSSTSINKEQFTRLMSQMSPEDIDALFSLYDLDHDGTVRWKEYICIITLIMHGTIKNKIRLIFNTFDTDGNDFLSKDEFLAATKRFSTVTNVQELSDKVFYECDVNGDGKISFQEFFDWVQNNKDTFEQLVGVLNIINMSDE